jgi:hypothetical protein
MDKKSAFIIDTNFIIENRNLTEVVNNLSDRFTVYVTQVSIDERISQKYLDLKSKYEKLQKISDDNKSIATIHIITPFERQSENDKKNTSYLTV